jgi:hypothetical protein
LGIPYNELGQRISAAELALYQCYYKLEPWGEQRADIRTASQTSFIASATGVTKQSGGKFTTEDFMLFRDKPKKEESEGEPPGLRDMFKSLARRK